MNDGHSIEIRKGNIVIGAMLVLTGLTIMLDRSGAFPWRNQFTLWPLVLGGIGLARFVQSPPGAPKQGLLFMAGAAWLLLGEARVISLEDSWPIALIALGVIVALNGGTRRRGVPSPGQPGNPMEAVHFRRMHRTLSPLAVIGIWIAIAMAVQVSGVRRFNDTITEGDRTRVIAVLSRSEHISRPGPFDGADVTTVMGKAEIDLRDAALAPGATATVHVFSAMGNVTMRVPDGWNVDSGAVSALGKIEDERRRPAEADTNAGPAPRLLLRGLVAFGRLSITS